METNILLSSTYLCRLCCEEDEHATTLFDEDTQLETETCSVINKYLALRVENDPLLPSKICSGCYSQLDATKSFLDLVNEGQKRLHDIRQNLVQGDSIQHEIIVVNNQTASDDVCGEQLIIEVVMDDTPSIENEKQLMVAHSCGSEFANQHQIDNRPTTPQNRVSIKDINALQDVIFKSSNLTRKYSAEKDSSGLYSNAIESARRLSSPKFQSPLAAVEDEKRLCERTTTMSQMKINTGENVFSCHVCNKSFKCKQNVDTHIRTVHEGETKHLCRICFRSFRHGKTLSLHMQTHSEHGTKTIYKCGDCSREFRHPSSLQYHRNTEHASKRQFICEVCSKSFKHQQHLKRHQAVHSEERPFHCTECSSTFKSSSNLLHHVRYIHRRITNYECMECGKQFPHSTALRVHKRTHSGLRPFKCDLCTKRFSQRGNLIEHLRTHTGIKPFTCQLCSRPFTTSSQLKVHQQRHRNERPFQCQYCDKAFIRKESLLVHLRRHANHRAYECQACHKTFADRWTLVKHTRVHTDERPYRCQVCNKTFRDSSNLLRHCKSLHTVHSTTTTDAKVENHGITDLVVEKSSALKPLLDTDGNPIIVKLDEGQQLKIYSNADANGGEFLLGIMEDGTTVPIDVASIPTD